MLHFLKRLFALTAAVACVVLSTSTAGAVVVWDEAIDGDVSTNRLAPSSAALVRGRNTLTATSVGPSATADREYITFSMPAETKLTRIYVEAYSGIDEIGFIAVQSGTTFTEPPTGTNVTNLLGYDHFGPGVYPLGRNILPNIGIGPGSIGFTAPLPADNYTFWLQQTGINASTYTIGFFVVPEPSALAMFAIGGFMWLASNRRQRVLL
jgi:hypothetical protein